MWEMTVSIWDMGDDSIDKVNSISIWDILSLCIQILPWMRRQCVP
jgi:hypothetical protein